MFSQNNLTIQCEYRLFSIAEMEVKNVMIAIYGELQIFPHFINTMGCVKLFV